MERNIRKSSWAALCAAPVLLAALGAAQAATIDGCRATVGFKVNPGGGAWGAVEASGDYFLSRNMVPTCEVKVVGTSTKAKPPTTTEILAGPMTKDECSMYNYLSSVDSKLNQAKVGEAYTTIGSMIAKISNMYAGGSLAQAGYEPMYTTATAVQTCIAELMSQ